jgi:hypothetical protein
MAKTRRPFTDEERDARRAAQRELVRASIEQLRSSDGWQGYLNARRPHDAATPAGPNTGDLPSR